MKFSKQNSRACVSTLNIGCILQLTSVAPHEPGKLASTRTEEPEDGEEGGDKINNEENESNKEHIEIELGGDSCTLIDVTMDIAKYSHIVLFNVNQLIDVNILQVKSVPIDQFTNTSEEHVESKEKAKEEFKDCANQVGREETAVVFESLPNFNSMNSVLHIHVISINSLKITISVCNVLTVWVLLTYFNLFGSQEK